MYQLLTACICAASDTAGRNPDNLLYMGQILPEKNGGLNGTPSLTLSGGWPFFAAVLFGSGTGETARKAAYAAAAVLRSAEPKADSVDSLRELLLRAGAAVAADAPDAGTGVMAAALTENQLSLAGAGDCRAYLVRDRSLYLLSRAAENADPGLPGAVSFTLAGKMQPGDQLLLCTPGLFDRIRAPELLQCLVEGDAPQTALQTAAARLAPSQTATATAVLIRLAEKAGE